MLLSLCSVSLNFILYADNTSIQDKGGIVSFSLFFSFIHLFIISGTWMTAPFKYELGNVADYLG